MTNTLHIGCAGSGKSFVLNYIIQELQGIHSENTVAITAPTGIAAINIGGQTIHNFAGIGLGRGDFLLEKAVTTPSSFDRWNRTQVLIIDEISMLDQKLFELLDEIGKAVKRNDLPFGGIQLIAVGDFLQLPPVNKEGRHFCFESHVWESAGLHLPSGSIYLKQSLRQNDEVFISILNEVRLGKVSLQSLGILNNCLISKKAIPTDGIIPTVLYCTNKDVDKENADKLNELTGELHKIQSVNEFQTNKTANSQSSKLKSLMETASKTIPEIIELKVGAQVMLLRNRNHRNKDKEAASSFSDNGNKGLELVNGSRGTVIKFVKSSVDSEDYIPVVKFDNGKTIPVGRVDYDFRSVEGDCVLIRKQVPLKLAW